MLKVSDIVSPNYPNILLYSLFYLLGGLGFALLGCNVFWDFSGTQ